MHTRRPEMLKEEVIRAFQCPTIIAELGRINSLNLRERVSVKGEVTKVSYISDIIDIKYLCCIFHLISFNNYFQILLEYLYMINISYIYFAMVNKDIAIGYYNFFKDDSINVINSWKY